MVGPGGAGTPRRNLRRGKSPGGKPNEGPGGGGPKPGDNLQGGPAEVPPRDDVKDLKNWLDRHQQKALKGGLLAGPLNEEGIGGVELIDLLRSNPELAARVREFTKAEMKEYRRLPGTERTGERQNRLFEAFPELYQQYIGATGQGIIYDAEGNPVRVADPNEAYGLREGDEFVPPKLIGPNGDELPPPVFGDEGVQGSEVTNQFLAARQQRMEAETNYEGSYFSLEELQGGGE